MKTSKTTAAWNRYHRAAAKAHELREKASTLSIAAIDATDATVRATLMRESAKLRKALEKANVSVEEALSAATAACYR